MLVKFELLKILRKKSTLIVMAVSLIVTGFLFGLPALQFQTYHQDGVIKGAKGIAFEKEQYVAISVPLTEEYVDSTIREVQELFQNPDNVGDDGNEQFLIGDAYWNGIAPREKLLNLIANTYGGPDEASGYNNLPNLDLTKEASFYEAMEGRREALLNTASRGLSQKQKDYWRNKAVDVELPLQYGYYEGWGVIISSFELLMFAILGICIVIAPVFSGEYQTGTAAVILSGKYGKTKLITAKIASSLIFATGAFVLHIFVAWGLSLLAFGTDGWNLPLQIVNTKIPYPYTFLQAALINTGIVYLVLLAMIGLTLFLSAKMKSPYLVLVVLVPVLFVPMFLSPNGTTGAYNLILFLLPYRSTVPEFGKYITYQFGGFVLDALLARMVLYSALTVMMMPLARRTFKRHQVS